MKIPANAVHSAAADRGAAGRRARLTFTLKAGAAPAYRNGAQAAYRRRRDALDAAHYPAVVAEQKHNRRVLLAEIKADPKVKRALDKQSRQMEQIDPTTPAAPSRVRQIPAPRGVAPSRIGLAPPRVGLAPAEPNRGYYRDAYPLAGKRPPVDPATPEPRFGPGPKVTR